MSEKASKWVWRIYGSVTGFFCIVTGYCLIAACVGIYRSGEKPFSREAVAVAFQGISIWVYLTLVLVVGGLLLSLFVPRIRKKGALPPAHMTLHRLHRKLDVQHDPSVADTIRSAQRNRCINRWITAGLLAVCGTMFLLYACNGSNFHPQDINGSVAKATVWMLICLSIPAGFAITTKLLAKRSMEKEIQLLLKYGVNRQQPAPEQTHNTAIRVTRLALLCVAVAITLYGLFGGGTLDVLTKAVNICTECIGLG